jgi:hypothetical protein
MIDKVPMVVFPFPRLRIYRLHAAGVDYLDRPLLKEFGGRGPREHYVLGMEIIMLEANLFEDTQAAAQALHVGK